MGVKPAALGNSLLSCPASLDGSLLFSKSLKGWTAAGWTPNPGVAVPSFAWVSGGVEVDREALCSSAREDGLSLQLKMEGLVEELD